MHKTNNKGKVWKPVIKENMVMVVKGYDHSKEMPFYMVAWRYKWYLKIIVRVSSICKLRRHLISASQWEGECGWKTYIIYTKQMKRKVYEDYLQII